MTELERILRSCASMERGLPQIVSSAEELNEALEQGRLQAKAELAAAGGQPFNMPPDVQERFEAAVDEITNIGTTQARSIRALARGQIALARGVRLALSRPPPQPEEAPMKKKVISLVIDTDLTNEQIEESHVELLCRDTADEDESMIHVARRVRVLDSDELG